MHVLWIAVVIVIIDQITKLLVLHNMYVGQSIPLIGDWLKLTYTENPGMAFGINFGPQGLVTILSISATILIFLYLYRVKDSFKWYRVSIGFILGGALGNIIDRVFYGVLFNGDPLFAGKVVDFIHVNLWRGYLPDAWPVIGGRFAALFPIWNVADMAIVVGVVGILFFQKQFQDSILVDSGIAEGSLDASDIASSPVDDSVFQGSENGMLKPSASATSMDTETSREE